MAATVPGDRLPGNGTFLRQSREKCDSLAGSCESGKNHENEDFASDARPLACARLHRVRRPYRHRGVLRDAGSRRRDDTEPGRCRPAGGGLGAGARRGPRGWRTAKWRWRTWLCSKGGGGRVRRKQMWKCPRRMQRHRLLRGVRADGRLRLLQQYLCVQAASSQLQFLHRSRKELRNGRQQLRAESRLRPLQAPEQLRRRWCRKCLWLHENSSGERLRGKVRRRRRWLRRHLGLRRLHGPIDLWGGRNC